MASNSNITLKGLSKILNLSISTISKSLNDSSEISQLTKDRVKEVAKLYNYPVSYTHLTLPTAI